MSDFLCVFCQISVCDQKVSFEFYKISGNFSIEFHVTKIWFMVCMALRLDSLLSCTGEAQNRLLVTACDPQWWVTAQKNPPDR